MKNVVVVAGVAAAFLVLAPGAALAAAPSPATSAAPAEPATAEPQHPDGSGGPLAAAAAMGALAVGGSGLVLARRAWRR